MDTMQRACMLRTAFAESAVMFPIIVFVVLFVMLIAAPYAGAFLALDEATTLKTQLRLHGELRDLEEIWLAALVTAQDAATATHVEPKGLILRWLGRDLGWTQVWELQLAIRHADGDENVVQIAPTAPLAGDRYEATLSYHPEGEVSIALRNVSRGDVVFVGNVSLSPRDWASTDARLYPSAGGTGVEVISIDAHPGYTQMGTPLSLQREFVWHLIRNPHGAATELADDLRLFAKDPLGLRLHWPAQPLPGQVRLSVVQGDASIELLKANWQRHAPILPIELEIPPGPFTLRLEYVDRAHAQTIAEMEGFMMSWERVLPADVAELTPDFFADEELLMSYAPHVSDQAMPYYLKHFHLLANAVQDDGFIDISVWRNPNDQERYNARVMENILSLAYFYTTKRPWNPYYGSEPLRARLEAALSFWIDMQNDDGRYSEYGENMWNLAATGFATKFMGEALRLLHLGPPIDDSLLQRAVEAQRRAIKAILTDAALYNQGKRFTNQFGNVWPGALAYLTLFPDPEIEALLHQRLADTKRDFQSAAGYYYERNSVDWSYNFGTHRSNTRMAWHYLQTGGLDDALIKAFETYFIEGEKLWFEWLSYNAVLEPDGSMFLLNRSIEARGRVGAVARVDTEMIDAIPLATAFATSLEERRQELARRRSEVERSWPWVSPLQVGSFEAFSPYPFLHQQNSQRHPSSQERDEATALLPYMASERFNHQRVDGVRPLVLTYVRRPDYYAAFNVGRPESTQQRFGLGVLWHPQVGAFLQSQTNSERAAWGTKAASESIVYEKDLASAAFLVGDEAWQPQTGNADLADGDVRIDYPLGSSTGEKSVHFKDWGIEVQVRHPGEFTEFIPLLVAPGDELQTSGGRTTLTREGIVLEIRVWGSEGVEVARSLVEGRVGRYEVIPLRLTARDELRYEIRLFDMNDGANQPLL